MEDGECLIANPRVSLRWEDMPEELKAELLGEQQKYGDLSPECQFEIVTKWLAKHKVIEGQDA